MKIALLQLNSGIDPDENFETVSRMVRETSADCIMTPEMTTLLQKDRAALDAAVQDEDTTIKRYRKLARSRGIYFLLGSAAIRRKKGTIVNRSFLIDPDGKVAAKYDKIHLFEASLRNGESYKESNTYEAGKLPVMAKVDDFRLGLSVCYDLRFSSLYAGYGKEKAHMISVPSAFTRSTGKAHWETLLRARAIETGAWILAPAQGGLHEDGRATYGRTLAVSPWGEVVGKLDHDEPGCLEIEIDKASVKEARARIPAWRQQ